MSRCSLHRSLTIFTDFGGSEIIPEQTPTVPAKMPLAGTLFLPPKNFSLKPFGQAVAEAAIRLKLKKRAPLSQRRRTARHDAGRACSGDRTHRGACYTQHQNADCVHTSGQVRRSAIHRPLCL